jgi:hypothetical protein
MEDGLNQSIIIVTSVRMDWHMWVGILQIIAKRFHLLSSFLSCGENEWQ